MRYVAATIENILGGTVTKKDLLGVICEQTRLSRNDTNETQEALLEIIKATL